MDTQVLNGCPLPNIESGQTKLRKRQPWKARAVVWQWAPSLKRQCLRPREPVFRKDSDIVDNNRVCFNWHQVSQPGQNCGRASIFSLAHLLQIGHQIAPRSQALQALSCSSVNMWSLRAAQQSATSLGVLGELPLRENYPWENYSQTRIQLANPSFLNIKSNILMLTIFISSFDCEFTDFLKPIF